MLSLNRHSLVNPLSGNAGFAFGTKSAFNTITFSVGTQIGGSGYLTKNSDSDDVTVSVSNGIASFSFPQTHLYLGVGDKVTAGANVFYLNGKINNSKWIVRTETGEYPSDITDIVVTSINKTFSDLKTAIDTGTSGLHTLVGSSDLTALQKSIKLAVYAMTETQSSGITITGWTVNKFNNIKIYTPYDIKTDCNFKQRHSGLLNTGYTLDVTTAGVSIDCQVDYTDIFGLGIDDSGHSIAIDTSTVSECRVFNNVTKGSTASTIKTGSLNQAVGNIIYSGVTAIDDTTNNNSTIAHNTIYGFTSYGINGGASTLSYNNILQNTTTCLNGLSSGNIFGTYTNDATAGSTGKNKSSVTITFKDVSASDFHLDFKSTPNDPITDGDDSILDLIPIDVDIDAEPMSGKGWPVGADRFVPNPVFAVGKDTSDLKTGSITGTVSNGKLTVTASQINEKLCVGCEVILNTVSQKFYLYEKLTDTEWNVVGEDGLITADVTSKSVVSIKYPFNSLYEAIDNNDSAGVGVLMGGVDLVAQGTKLTIACAEGDLYRGTGIDSSFTTDENHSIKIYTPYEPGFDCNESLRHRGYFSSNLCCQVGVIDGDAISLTKDYITIDGLQITSDKCGILSESGTHLTITNNIIFSTGAEGISFDFTVPKINSDGLNIIAGNIIYDCSKNGLKLNYSGNTSYLVYNNTLVGNYQGCYFDIDLEEKYDLMNISFYNNIIQDSQTTDCFCTTGVSEFIDSRNNYCSDQSILAFSGKNDISSYKVLFVDKRNRDLRPTLYDSLRMTDVLDLSSDPDYNFSTNSKGDTRSRYKWDAGATSWTPNEEKEIHYSIGANTSNLDSEVSRQINISDNILTFIGNNIDSNIGVGDKVSYEDGGTKFCYLAERGSQNVWLVRSNTGELNVADGTGLSVNSVNRVTSTIESSDTVFKTESGSSGDLITNNIKRMYGWCYADGVDTFAATLSSWNCNSTNKLIISTPWNTNTQTPSINRHIGYWSNSGYDFSLTENSPPLTINSDYITVRGLKIKPNINTYDAVVINASGCDISGNLIKESNRGVYSPSAVNSNKVLSNVIYDTVLASVDIQNGYVLNNTLVGDTGVGLQVSGVNVTGINNIISGFPTCINGTLLNSKSNITSDATAGSSNQNKSSVSLNFNDSSNEDYRLRRDDIQAINHGCDVSDNFGEFFYGIDSTEISNEWSIGADISPSIEDIDLYFSVSKNTANLRESVSTLITITSGVAVFSDDQEDDIGIGDKILYDSSSKECYLSTKISKSSWNVVTKYGLTPDDITDASVDSITHTFEEISDAVYGTGSDGIREFIGDSTNPFFNFVAAKYRIHLPVYKGSAYHSTKVVVKHYTTSDNYYLRVYAPHDIDRECNNRQRHDGSNSLTGFTNEAFLIPSVSDECIRIESNYTSIDGLMIKPFTQYNAHAVRSKEAIGTKIIGNMIRYCDKVIINDNGSYVFDDFRDAGTFGNNFETEFNSNWSRRVVNDVESIAVADVESTWHTLTADFSDDFDFEFGIYSDDQSSTEIDSLKFGLFNTSNVSQFEVSYEHDVGSGNHSIAADGYNLEAKADRGRVYRIRMTRGRTITLDGVMYDPSDTTLRLYYFDDWSDGGGTGTGQWKEYPGTITSSFTGTGRIRIYGESRHGILYVKSWVESGAYAASLTEGPGYLFSSKFINNIMITCNNGGIKTGGADYVYNNTAYLVNQVSGLAFDNKPTDRLINNIADTVSGTNYGDNTAIDYCISDESSSGTSRNNQVYESIFLTAPSDLHPRKSDIPIRGKGKNLSYDSYFSFDYDAAMSTRDRRWDIGALEYTTEKKVCYAVGVYQSSIAEKSGGSLGYTIAIDDHGRSVITFTIPQSNSRMGIGNEVIDITPSNLPNGCLIYEKIDESNWVVTDYFGSNVTPISNKSVDSIRRPFATLAEAVSTGYANNVFGSQYLNSKLLDSLNTRVLLACYDDTDYSSPENFIEIENISCDPDYFLKIFSPNKPNESNNSQRHNGNYPGKVRGNGYAIYDISSESDYEILVDNTDYIEIEGIVYVTDDVTRSLPKRDAIKVINSLNPYIASNFLSSTGTAINIESIQGSYSTDMEVIINNSIYGCDENGIKAGSSSVITNSKAVVYNNTTVGCGRGIYLLTSPGAQNSTLCFLKNNISLKSIIEDFVIENRSNFLDASGNIKVTNRNNISGDTSVKNFYSLEGQYDIDFDFIDELNKLFQLNRESLKDKRGIDSGIDLSEDEVYPFKNDILNSERPDDQWDAGAFELVNASAESNLSFQELIVSGVPFATNNTQTFTLHLRETLTSPNFLTGVDSNVQFESITSLNTFLDTLSSIYNQTDINVYVQGGKSFTGSFSFNDKGLRSVILKTNPDEISDGRGSLIYDGPLIDDDSMMSELTIDQLNIYSDDSVVGTQQYLIDDTYNGAGLKIKIINSVLQVNHDAVANTADCTVESTNSIIAYRSSLTDIYMVKNSNTGNLFANSIVIGYHASDMTFTTTNVASNDFVDHCLSYNYGSGYLNFGNSLTKVIAPQENKNPEFIEVVLTSGFTPSELMAYEFKPSLTSPCIDNGENSYVSGIEYDIVGNDRIFDFRTVDIGPYEIQVNNKFFYSEDIQEVFQDKLNLNFDNNKFTSTFGDTVYDDLYSQFKNKESKAIEFSRGSKIIFRLKESSKEYRTFSDKKMEVVHSFEAYYDSGSRSIVISKEQKLFHNLFRNIFKDSKYVFYFNESKHKLTVYINDTYGKGLSGNRNVVKNVKFGGQSIASS